MEMNANTFSLKEKSKGKKKRLTTWNVRSLGICGKLVNLKLEIKRLNIDIIGISKLNWTRKGNFWSVYNRTIFNGDDHRIPGVGFIMKKKIIRKKVVKVIQYSHQIISIKLDTKPIDPFILKVYMPTSTHEDEKIKEIYRQISEVIEITKKKTNL